jgi:hypothetical protein
MAASYARQGRLLLVLLLAASPARALVFQTALSPIQLDGHPGDVVNRQFELHVAAGQPVTQFVSRIEDFWSNEDGTSSFFEPVGKVARSCVRWVDINPVEATVQPDSVLSIRVTTTIPRDALPGGYWCALTVDQVADPLNAPTGVGVQINASVSIGIYVYIAPLERVARIVDVTVGTEQASVLLRNEGNTPLRIEGRFEFLRHGQSVPVAVAVLPSTPLLLDPAPTRRITVDLPGPDLLPAGRYLVRAIVDVGLDHFLAAQKEVDIAARLPAPQPTP